MGTGCVIPSGYTTQGNGKPRPESIIGTKAGSPIVLGQTKIDDALPRVIEQVSGMEPFDPRQINPMHMDPRSLLETGPLAALMDWRYWSVNVERRQIAVPYRLKTGWTVYPFQVVPKTNSRLLVLTTDDKGTVIAKGTLEPEDLARHGLTPVEQDPRALMNLIGKMATERLRDAGLVPAELAPLLRGTEPSSRP